MLNRAIQGGSATVINPMRRGGIDRARRRMDDAHSASRNVGSMSIGMFESCSRSPRSSGGWEAYRR